MGTRRGEGIGERGLGGESVYARLTLVWRIENVGTYCELSNEVSGSGIASIGASMRGEGGGAKKIELTSLRRRAERMDCESARSRDKKERWKFNPSSNTASGFASPGTSRPESRCVGLMVK